MKTPHSSTEVEARWKTYLKGVLLLSPAIILWEAVRVKCVPILVNICQNSEPYKGSAEVFWNCSMFFVRYGFLILATTIAIFVLLELFSKAWKQYRRSVVGGVVWLWNLIVICGLAALFTVTLIVFPGLLK